MNRLHLMIGLGLGLFLYQAPVVSLAADEWVRVGGTHKYDRYVSMTSIGVWGSTVTLWTLRDSRLERTIPRGPYRSLKIKRQYHCEQRRSRPLHVRYYPQGLAQGRVLYAAPATREWSRVIPGSDDDAEMKVACRTVLSTLRPGSRG